MSPDISNGGVFVIGFRFVSNVICAHLMAIINKWLANIKTKLITIILIADILKICAVLRNYKFGFHMQQ